MHGYVRMIKLYNLLQEFDYGKKLFADPSFHDNLTKSQYSQFFKGDPEPIPDNPNVYA